MEQLRKGDRHKQPAAKPFGLPPQQALNICNIIKTLQTIYGEVRRNGHTKAIQRADSHRHRRETGPDGRSISRRERSRDPRVTIAERLSVISQETSAQSDEEASKDSMQKEDQRERQCNAQVRKSTPTSTFD